MTKLGKYAFLLLASISASVCWIRGDSNIAKHRSVDARQTKTIYEHRSGDYVYEIKYRPTASIERQFMRSRRGMDFDSLRQQLDDRRYFELSFKFQGHDLFAARSQSFSELLNRLCFETDYIWLCEPQNSEQIAPVDITYPRTFGLTDHTSLLVCFKNPSLRGCRNFTVVVADFLNNSHRQLKFSFTNKDIELTN